jgi:hypothetical protein
MASLIFVQWFENHKSAGVPRDALRKAFGPLLEEPEADYWRIPCDAGNACTFFLEPFGPDSVHQFVVQQCCHDSSLWDSLLTVLGLGNAILYSPGCSTAFIADEGVMQHLPPGLLDKLGIPAVVRNAQEIRAAFQGAQR